MLGALLDIGKTFAENLFADERQDDQQNFNSAEAAATRKFNMDMAREQRAWELEMSNTAVQRRKEDLRMAGLNPMLALMQGSAQHGSGATAQGAQATSGIASPSHGPSISASMQSASAAAVNDAMEERVRAETERTRAETAEIKERTPTHAVNIRATEQQIEESRNRIEKILAEIPHIRQQQATSAAQAAHYGQQIKNLQEQIPQIRETVRNLQALTKLHGAMEGKTKSETEEIQQRISAQLPQLTRVLGELERQSRTLAIPGKTAEASAQESFLGQMGAYLRTINPLQKLLNQVPQ